MPRPSPHPLRLSGDLSLRNISELHQRLTEALAEHQAIDLQTAEVESADTGTLQLLVSAAKTAAARGRQVSLTATADGPVARTLVAAGFFAADGTPKIPSLSSWTIVREAA